MRNEFRRFFIGQAKRAIKIWLDADGYLSSTAEGEFKDPASAMLGVNEDVRAVAASRPYVLEMTVAALNNTAAITGAATIVATDPMVLFLTDQSAQRVVKINAATRRGIQRTITLGQAAGYSPYEIAYGSTATRKAGYRPLKGTVERLYNGRPECIARTELAYSNNGASLHQMDQMGLGQVQVIDGPGCALTHHVQGLRPGEASAEDINGRVITVKEANNWQVAHPNCRRVFLPMRQSPRKPTTPPMEAEAFITRPLTAAQRARVARDMARTRVTAPPKPPAPQVIEEAVPTPTATVYERAAEIRANQSMTTLDDALALGKELEEEWQKEWAATGKGLQQAVTKATRRSKQADEARQKAFRAYQRYDDELYDQLSPEQAREVLAGRGPLTAVRIERDRLRKVYEAAREESEVAFEALKKARTAEGAAVNSVTKAVLQRTREMGRGTGAARQASSVPVRGRPVKVNREAFEWAQDQLPQDWLVLMQQKRNGGAVKLTSKPRGNYMPLEDRINTSGKQTPSKMWSTPEYNKETSLHELVHRVQFSARGKGPADITVFDRMNDITHELYKVRTTSPQGVQSPIGTRAGYPSAEKFREGYPPWPHDYMGKDYGYAGGFRNETSEVLTMGVEALLGPGGTGQGTDAAHAVLRQDKQLMQFLLGVLAGI